MNFGMESKKPYLVVGIFVLILVVMWIAFSYDKSPEVKQATPTTAVVGDADTIEDTMENVLAMYEETGNELDQQRRKNKELEEQLLLINAQLDQLLQKGTDDYDEILKRAESMINENIGESKPSDVSTERYPVNQSREPQGQWLDTLESGFDQPGSGQQVLANDQKAIDQIVAAVDAVGQAFGGEEQPKSVKDSLYGQDTKSRKQEVVPVFTIPKNATIFNSFAATALIGRIPIQNSVSDPYRFKILTGPEAISSNSIYLPPELSAMTFSGTASGDWNLSCVRGAIDSVTFTFNDGEIVTVNTDGWISDEYGVPCINGEKISNAGPVLAKRVMAGALTSGADTYARAQTDTVITGSGVAVDIEDANKYATYNALSGGARELERHLDKRLAQIFDAIYVANGTKVMIHIEDVIEINRDTNNRKVRYDNENHDYFAD